MLLLAIILACGALSVSPFGADIETRFGVRWLYALRGPLPAPDNLVVIPLDDSTAKALGADIEVERWPRSLHACLLNKLTAGKPAAIVFDVRFARNIAQQESVEAASAQHFEPWVGEACELRTGAAATRQLGAAIRAAGTVLLPSYLGRKDELSWETFPDPAVAEGALAVAAFPLPEVGDSVNQFWTFYPAPDGSPDPQPTLVSLAVAAASEGASPTALRHGLAKRRLESLQNSANRTSAASSSLESLLSGPSVRRLNFYGAPGELPSINYVSALQPSANNPLSQVRGKVVFIGAAEHSSDNRMDSYLSAYPSRSGQRYGGVELMATAFANLRDGNGLRLLRGWHSLLLTVALGGALALAGWRLEPARLLLVAGLTVLGYAFLASRLFASQHLCLPLLVPLVLEVPLLTLTAIVLQYLRSRGVLRATQGLMDSYVTSRVASRHLQPGGDTSMQLVHGTVLATDASNYTRMVEQLGGDPRLLAPVMNAYYSAISTPVAEARPPGHIIDTAGDGMLALWDSLTDQPGVRLAACRAACAISQAVSRFNAEFPETPLPTRIGLHAGPLALGDLEARGRRFFKAVGDVTNTASRIEGLNKLLGTHILASQDAVAALEEALSLRACGRFLLPGKLEPLALFEVRGEAGKSPELALLDGFAGALALFESHQWAAAGQAFKAVLEQYPADGPSQFYLSLCGDREQHPSSQEDPALVVVTTK